MAHAGVTGQATLPLVVYAAAASLTKSNEIGLPLASGPVQVAWSGGATSENGVTLGGTLTAADSGSVTPVKPVSPETLPLTTELLPAVIGAPLFPVAWGRPSFFIGVPVGEEELPGGGFSPAMVEKFTVAVEVNDSADVVYWIDADVPVAATAAVAPEPRATLTIVVLASETAATMPQGLLRCLMLRMPSPSRYANSGPAPTSSHYRPNWTLRFQGTTAKYRNSSQRRSKAELGWDFRRCVITCRSLV